MGFEQPGPLQPALDLAFDVAWTVFAAFGIHAQKGFQMRSPAGEFLRKIQHLPQTPIPGDKPHVRIEHGKSLVDVVKRCLKQVQFSLKLGFLLHSETLFR